MKRSLHRRGLAALTTLLLVVSLGAMPSANGATSSRDGDPDSRSTTADRGAGSRGDDQRYRGPATPSTPPPETVEDVEAPLQLDVEPSATDEGAEPLPTHPGTLQRQQNRRTTSSVTALAITKPVELRALVIATDDADYGLAPWTSTLDRVGAAYDVVLAGDTPLTRNDLVDAAGVGRYNAILLTSSALLMDDNGSWVSALEPTEWFTLWDYEREFGVRQATLYTSYGTWPEETCFLPISEGGVDEAGITASLTPTGAGVFDYLNPTADIPVQLSWVYRNSIAQTCANSEPVLTSGDAVLGAVTTQPDGREQLALTFSQNEHLMQSHLLTYGLFRWASRGMFLGEQRHYLKLDVDDYFNTSDIMLEDLTIAPDPWAMSGDDALLMRTQTNQLHADHPLAADFRLSLAYNGEGVGRRIPAPNCSGGGEDALVAASLCVRDDVEWINHTFSHPKMNTTSLRVSLDEIRANRRVANSLGISVADTVLKTGEYSGLGVYHPDTTNDIDPPTDFGLMASNPALIQAAQITGSRFLHGNMSFASHVPDCFNCTIRHPMDQRIEIVPDWPTNIAYFSSTPAQETAFYNYYYGPQGLFPYYAENQTYEQVIRHESTAAVNRIAQGSMYTNTMHIPNLNDYGGGNTLAFDWLNAVVSRYEAYYAVPLLSPSWADLAQGASTRTRHFDVLDAVRAVYDPASGMVTVTSSQAGTVLLTGVDAPGSTTYGNDRISAPALVAGQSQQWPALPRP